MLHTTNKIAKELLSRRISGTLLRPSSNLHGISTPVRRRWGESRLDQQQQQSSTSLPKKSSFNRPCDPSRRFFSSIRRCMPLSMMAKLEIVSLGSYSDNDDGNESVQSGILTRVIPVDSMVRTGDVVATVKLPPKTRAINSSDNGFNGDDQSQQREDGEVDIYAPQTGRVTEVFHQIQEPVKIGDSLMFIDDTVVQEDRKVLEQQLQQIASGQTQQQKMKLLDDYLKTLLDIEDPFRLQTILYHIPAPLQSRSFSLYERLMELQKEDPTELANTHTQISSILHHLGDFEMMFQHLHKALDLRTEALGSEHLDIAETCVHLGDRYLDAGDYETSLKYRLQAVGIQEKLLGEEHSDVASTYNNIGVLHYQSQDYARAIRESEKALKIRLNNGGEMHVDTADTYHNIGVSWKHLGDFNTAQGYLQKALHVRLHQYKLHQVSIEGKRDGTIDAIDNATNDRLSRAAAAHIAASHTVLGQLYSEMVNCEAAMEQYDAALALQQRVFGPDSAMVANTHHNIGAVHYERGNHSYALGAFQTGLDILRAKEPNHFETAASWNKVGLTHLQMGKAEKALECHKEALRILTDVYGPKHPNLATTIGSVGNVYKTQELWEKALVEYEVAHELLEAGLGTSQHPDVASSYNNMGLVISKLPGREAEALEKYRAACKIFEKSLGSEHPHCGSCRFNIALLLQSQGWKEDAKTEFEAAREIWTTHFGPGHVHTENAQKGADECS